MDIDVMGRHIHGLLAFKNKIEEMISGADAAKSGAQDTVSELLGFKSDFEAALPEIRKAVADASALVDDVAAIKKQLEPVIEFVAAQQKAVADAKAAEEQKAADALKATQQHAAEGAEPVDEKPVEPVAEAAAEPAVRSESERGSG